MTALIIILVVALFLELRYRPRLDYTRSGKILLWYGRRNRRYIVVVR